MGVSFHVCLSVLQSAVSTRILQQAISGVAVQHEHHVLARPTAERTGSDPVRPSVARWFGLPGDAAMGMGIN
jgi:hypothetical protein